MSYETTGSPLLCDAQTPPNAWKSVLPAAGPYSRAPVVLLKTAKLVLFHCTYCVAPTLPFTSGGLLPGRKSPSPTPTPSKLTPVGTAAEDCAPEVVWSGPSGPPLCVGKSGITNLG